MYFVMAHDLRIRLLGLERDLSLPRSGSSADPGCVFYLVEAYM